MKAQAYDEGLANDETVTDSPEPTSKASLVAKMERRRRIEDLHEERRLRDELNEF